MNTKELDKETNKEFIKEFIECRAKSVPYFINALFIAVYEPKRNDFPVKDTKKHGKGLASKAYMSDVTIFDYLKFKKVLKYNEFETFCKILNIDIARACFPVQKYCNIAEELLQNMEETKKLSSHKETRTSLIEKLKVRQDKEEIDFIEQFESNTDYIEEEMLSCFNGLSTKELAYLYQLIDIFDYTFCGDEEFLRRYLELNSVGKKLFCEALETVYAEKDPIPEDNAIDFIRQCSNITQGKNQKNITPQSLVNELGRKMYYSYEHAKSLCLYLYMDKDAWNTLILIHKFIKTANTENLPDIPIDEVASLYLFLDWLCKLPSLKNEIIQ